MAAVYPHGLLGAMLRQLSPKDQSSFVTANSARPRECSDRAARQSDIARASAAPHFQTGLTSGSRFILTTWYDDIAHHNIWQVHVRASMFSPIHLF